MKKVSLIICIFMLISFCSSAYELPKFTNYVNDYGKLLSVQETNSLNSFLKEYQDSTSTQIAVLTLSSFDDQNEGPLFDYSVKVFRTWKIGQKSKNNGVLLVVVKNLATKRAPGLRIVTGYGTEGPLPDAVCKEIIEKMRPMINQGKYYQGINIALTSMISRIKGEYKSDNNKVDGVGALKLALAIVVEIVILFLVIVFFSNLFSKKEDDSPDTYHSSRFLRDSESTAGIIAGSSFSSSRSSEDSDDSRSFSTSENTSYSDSGGSSFDGGGGGDTGGGGAGD